MAQLEAKSFSHYDTSSMKLFQIPQLSYYAIEQLLYHLIRKDNAIMRQFGKYRAVH